LLGQLLAPDLPLGPEAVDDRLLGGELGEQPRLVLLQQLQLQAQTQVLLRLRERERERERGRGRGRELW
jgi:hypothetical protein